MNPAPVRALIVEDEENLAQTLLRGITRGLSDLSLAADLAFSLQEARRRTAETRYDLYLLDYSLPDGNGLQLLQELRERGVREPVIFLTGRNEPDLVVKVMKAGANDYLVKGNLPQGWLSSSVRHALEMHRRDEERRQTAHALHEANERLRALVSASRLGVLHLDTAGRITQCNSAASEMFGYAADALQGVAVAKHFGKAPAAAVCGRRCGCSLDPAGLSREAVLNGASAESEQEFRALLDQVLSGDVVSGIERVIEAPGPRSLQLSMSAAALYDERNNVIGATALLADVTEARRAQEAVRLANERLRAVISSSVLAIVSFDEESKITGWNPAAERMFGWRSDEVIGKLPPFVPEEERGASMAIHQRVMSGEPVQGVELCRQTRDGREIFVSLSGAPLQSGSHIVGTTALLEDITERKRSEQREQRSTRQLRLLHEINTAISSSLELSRVLETLRTLLIELMDVAGGAIYLSAPGRGNLRLAESWGIPDSLCLKLDAFARSRFHNQAVLEERKPVVMADLREHPPFSALDLSGFRPELQSYASFPLTAKGETHGVIDLFSRRPVRFTPDQAPLFEALGQQVGVAIEHARLFRQVQAGRERLQSLSRQLVEVQEAERRYIARELHDEIGQALTGLKLILDTAPYTPGVDVMPRLQQAQGLVNELTGRVREMALDLRPTVLDDLGLVPALLWHFGRYTTHSKIEVEFRHSGMDGRRLESDIETGAFRIVQEALTNVARHAGVSSAAVRLWANEERLTIQVQDCGRGFYPEEALTSGASSGLLGMRERATLLNGQIQVESAPGEGCRLTAELPLSSAMRKVERRAWPR